MQSCVLLNKADRAFAVKPLPEQAQFSPVYGILVKDSDSDGKTDIVLGGNFYQAKPEAGRYDAGYGLLLKGDGRGVFTSLSSKQSGLHVNGQVRDVADLHVGTKSILFFALNNHKSVFINGRLPGLYLFW